MLSPGSKIKAFLEYYQNKIFIIGDRRKLKLIANNPDYPGYQSTNIPM